MKVGIIGAMDEEIEAIKDLISNPQTEIKSKRAFLSGQISNQDVVLTRCDVGKVNGAIAAQQLIDHYGADLIINMGSAGAINPTLNVGDIVIATEAIQHDVDLTGWGLPPGAVMFDTYLAPDTGQLTYKSKQAFAAEPELQNLAIEIAQTLSFSAVGDVSPKIVSGRILSSDSFVNDHKKVADLFETYEGWCTDMEAAAIAQTCFLNDVPFLIVRTVSDKADGSATLSFHQFLVAATANYATLLSQLLGKLA